MKLATMKLSISKDRTSLKTFPLLNVFFSNFDKIMNRSGREMGMGGTCSPQFPQWRRHRIPGQRSLKWASVTTRCVFCFFRLFRFHSRNSNTANNKWICICFLLLELFGVLKSVFIPHNIVQVILRQVKWSSNMLCPGTFSNVKLIWFSSSSFRLIP